MQDGRSNPHNLHQPPEQGVASRRQTNRGPRQAAPRNQNNLTSFNYRGWHEHDRTRSHDEMGVAFVLVTPSHNWLYIADPDVLMNMYR